MYISSTQVRVRYAETDPMGYVYYGNYAAYYEVGRVEALRQLGQSYKSMEECGIMMPVLDLKSIYVKPALYDDLLTIQTTVKSLPAVKMHFRYDIFNQHDELINYGDTTLVFFDIAKRRPRRADDKLLAALQVYFNTI
ncbi:MAG: thioesterase family protein [Bacteroidota bacterium]|nr:thioesterase family protein [Bacteroidota bacterium]